MSHKFLLFKLKIKRDPETFGLFYDTYADRIYRFIYFKIGIKEDVEDITSEVFLKFWKHINKDIHIENINALIYSIARNSVVDYYRKKNNQETLLDETEWNKISENQISKLESPEKISDIKLLIVGIEKYLSKLKDEYKEIIILRFVEEYSISEISKIMNKTTGASKVLLHRAIKKLKQFVN